MEHGENNMNISDDGFNIIKKFEGCELEAYKCAAGVWTIGYGHTKDVQEGDKWTEEKAEFMNRIYIENVWCFSKEKLDYFRHSRRATLF